ncbi:hypothetical protein EMCRGX_G014364 [Ephydatia muelleri]
MANSYTVSQGEDLKLVLTRTPPQPQKAAKRSSCGKPVLLPITRVRTIMKTDVNSSVNTSCLSQESTLLITKATEMFIAELAKQSSKVASQNAANEVTYKHLATAVHSKPDELKFLFDVLPEKMLAKDALAWVNSNKPD